MIRGLDTIHMQVQEVITIRTCNSFFRYQNLEKFATRMCITIIMHVSIHIHNSFKISKRLQYPEEIPTQKPLKLF